MILFGERRPVAGRTGAQSDSTGGAERCVDQVPGRSGRTARGS